MNLNDKRVIKTRAAIREALLTLFEQKPIEQITVSALSKEAGINRRTFYLHYSNVNDIILDIEDNLEKNLQEAIQTQEVVNVYTIIECLNSVMEANSDYFRRISTRPDGYRLQLRSKDVLKNALKAKYANCSVLSEEEIDTTAEFAIWGLMGVYTSWLKNPEERDLNNLVDIVAKVTNAGINQYINRSN